MFVTRRIWHMLMLKPQSDMRHGKFTAACRVQVNDQECKSDVASLAERSDSQAEATASQGLRAVLENSTVDCHTMSCAVSSVRRSVGQPGEDLSRWLTGCTVHHGNQGVAK